jgi:hypothetical protein
VDLTAPFATQADLFREHWRKRRIDLRGLSPQVRRAAWAGIAGSTACAIVVVVTARGLTPLGHETVPKFGTIGRLAVVAGYLGFAVGAAVLVSGSLLDGWVRPTATRLVLGGLACYVAGTVVVQANHVLSLNALLELANGAPYPNARAGLVRALAWTGVAFGAGAALIPLRLAGRVRTVLPAAAAAPFVLCAVAYGIAGSTPTQLPSAPSSLQSGIAAGLLQNVIVFEIAVTLLLLWQAVAGIRASRDLAYGVGKAAARLPVMIPVFLGTKAVFVALGLAGLLPIVFGGGSAVWHNSRHDGLVSWLVALAAGIGVFAWFLRARRPSASTRGLAPGIALAAGLLFLFLCLASVGLALGNAVSLVSNGAALRILNVADWFNDESLTEMFSAVFVVGAIGVLLIRRRPSLAAFLLLFLAWAAPRAIHGLVGDNGQSGVVNYVTLDAAITAALVVAYAALPFRGLASRRGEVLIALVVVTAIAYAGFASSLLPQAVKREWFWVALAFPLIYQLLFDSSAINEAGDRRPVRLLSVVGAATVLLAMEVVLVAIGALNAKTVTGGSLGQALFAVPLAAMLVAAATTEEELQTSAD